MAQSSPPFSAHPHSVLVAPARLTLAAGIRIAMRVVLRLLLIFVASAPVRVLQTALQIAMGLLAHATRIVLVLSLIHI